MRSEVLRELLAALLPDPLGQFPQGPDGEIERLVVSDGPRPRRRGEWVLSLEGEGTGTTALGERLGATDDGPEGALLGLLGAHDAGTWAPDPGVGLLKLVAYVPDGHQGPVLDALAAAGAGHLGRYDSTAFLTRGLGRFRPLEGARPFVGDPGEVAEVPEWRIETALPSHLAGRAVAALRRVHPYEEPAIDLIALQNAQTVYGRGRLGVHPSGVVPEEAARLVGELLGGGAFSGPGGPAAARLGVWLEAAPPPPLPRRAVDLGIGVGPAPEGVRAWIAVDPGTARRWRGAWLVQRLRRAVPDRSVEVVDRMGGGAKGVG